MRGFSNTRNSAAPGGLSCRRGDCYRCHTVDVQSTDFATGPAQGLSTFASQITSGDFDAHATGSCIAGVRGIFGNDGIFELNIPALYGIEKPAAAATGSGALITDLTGWLNAGAQNDMTITHEGVETDAYWEVPTAAEQAKGWNWKLVSAVPDYTSYWHLYSRPDGKENGMWLVRDGSAANSANPGTADGLHAPVSVTNAIDYGNLSQMAPQWFTECNPYSPIGTVILRVMEPHEVDPSTGDADWTQGSWRNPALDLAFINKKEGTAGPNLALASTSMHIGWARSHVGFCRRQLFRGTGEDGQDDQVSCGPCEVYQDAGVLGADKAGFDIVCRVENQSGTTQPQVSVHRMKQTAGKTFPNGNWRNSNEVVLAHDPFPGATADGAHLRVKIQLKSYLNYEVTVSRTAAAPADPSAAVFVDPIVVFTSGSTPPQFPGTTPYTSVTREKHYQLRPCCALPRGGFYNLATNYTSLTCVSDVDEFADSTKDLADEADEGEGHDVVAATLGAKLTLPQCMKFDTVAASDEGTGPGQLHSAYYPPNAANIASVLGMPSFKYVDAATEPEFVSTDDPSETTVKPEIAVEMPQFNIRSYNGFSTDSGKVISIVPGAELTEQKTGQLFYSPNFKIPIQLNVKEPQRLYQLIAQLKTTDGKMLDVLRQPTSLTLLLEQGPESKMARAMSAAMQQLRGLAADRQGNEIATAGLDFARV